MHASHLVSSNAQISQARLGSAHGYRIDGDSAALNAEIDVFAAEHDVGAALSLQLWACEEPYRGGPLSGFKVTETPIAAQALGARLQHDSVGFARPPASARDYAMVLVLADQERAGAPVDFANYPQRQRFVVPHLRGATSYLVRDDGSVSIFSGGVLNPRAEDNLSGSLSLQLWALAAPYDGGVLTGSLVASVDLGQLQGGAQFSAGEFNTGFDRPTSASPYAALVLVEWTAQGYLARDYVQVDGFVSARDERVDEPVTAVMNKFTSEAVEPEVVTAPAAVEEARAVPPVVAEPAPVAAPPPVAAPAAPAPVVADATADRRPSLRSASAAELARVGGIAPKLAAQLLKAGPIASFEEIAKARGIGDKTMQKLRKAFRA